jgi:tetratricopeptide (TPR) repeat protein
MKKYPLSVFDHIMNGIVLYHSGKYAEAIKEFNHALEEKPEYRTVYYKRALAYAAIGKKNAVLEDLKSSARLGYEKAQVVLRSKNIIY